MQRSVCAIASPLICTDWTGVGGEGQGLPMLTWSKSDLCRTQLQLARIGIPSHCNHTSSVVTQQSNCTEHDSGLSFFVVYKF